MVGDTAEDFLAFTIFPRHTGHWRTGARLFVEPARTAQRSGNKSLVGGEPVAYRGASHPERPEETWPQDGPATGESTVPTPGPMRSLP